MISLGEERTPLVASARVGPSLGLQLYFKLENCNPSGSYKDRFAAAEVSRLWRLGVRACVATSSGNTGSALAAYCARSGIRCAIVVGDDAPSGKLAQMRAHGATVFRVPDFARDPAVTTRAFGALDAAANQYGMPLVVSAYRYCPEGMAGVEPIAREVCEQRPGVPDHVFVPVGGGGLFTAVCRGFESLPGARPRIHAVQPDGCLTVVASFLRGDTEIRTVESATRISGLSVPFDIDAGLALGYLRAAGGSGIAVSDAEVYEAQKLLLLKEGIYAEPAGAAALAGLLRAAADGVVTGRDSVVGLVTGHGFKDPDSVAAAAEAAPSPCVSAKDLLAAIRELAGR
ncbi:MAG: pyridoxal-phosphate dependent enzyme [Bryobacterales bacterium]|nr:pyridoxal-phosphate dependent enzyme [Bryobacterales bacterium]